MGPWFPCVQAGAEAVQKQHDRPIPGATVAYVQVRAQYGDHVVRRRQVFALELVAVAVAVAVGRP